MYDEMNLLLFSISCSFCLQEDYLGQKGPISVCSVVKYSKSQWQTKQFTFDCNKKQVSAHTRPAR